MDVYSDGYSAEELFAVGPNNSNVVYVFRFRVMN